MLIILRQQVKNLGDSGDVVRVKPGYGRNFLIPRGFAIPANERNVAELNHQKGVAEALRRKQLAIAQALAGTIAENSVTLRREVGEENRIFGSITPRDIAEALAERGIEVDRKLIELDDTIRTTGLFSIKIHLHRDVTAELRVFVVAA